VQLRLIAEGRGNSHRVDSAVNSFDLVRSFRN
jgi:hypothetical protein